MRHGDRPGGGVHLDHAIEATFEPQLLDTDVGHHRFDLVRERTDATRLVLEQVAQIRRDPMDHLKRGVRLLRYLHRDSVQHVEQEV